MRMIGMVALVAVAMLALAGVASAGPMEHPFLYRADSASEPVAFVAASAVSAPAAITTILDDRDVR